MGNGRMWWSEQHKVKYMMLGETDKVSVVVLGGTLSAAREMLLFSLLISLLMNHGGQAMPVPQTVAPLQRSLASIIWSCFLTLFLCAWVSAHPNIPPAEEYGRRAVWRRAKLMFWTIVAPELVLACAVRQWFAAQEIADTYNELKGARMIPYL